jgi:hypothetical protein
MAPAMRDVPVFGASFNAWFPAVAALHTALVAADAWGAVGRAVVPARVAAWAGSGGGGGAGAGAARAERGRALVRREAAALAAGSPLGAGLAAELDGELPEAPPPAASPARSETELGGGGWRAALGGGRSRPAAPPPSESTARRIAGLSPLTRSLLRGEAPAAGERAALLGAVGGGADSGAPSAGGGLDDVFSRLDAGGRIDDGDV